VVLDKNKERLNIALREEKQAAEERKEGKPTGLSSKKKIK